MPELNSAGPSIKREELEMPAERQRRRLASYEGTDCDSQVRVVGATAAGSSEVKTLRSGDGVFCSGRPRRGGGTGGSTSPAPSAAATLVTEDDPGLGAAATAVLVVLAVLLGACCCVVCYNVLFVVLSLHR